MRKDILLRLFIGLFAFVCFRATAAEASASAGLLMASEQAARIEIAGGRAANSQNQFLSDLEQAIRRANPGIDSESLRRPVSTAAIRKLQLRSALRGNYISTKELSAATDLAQTLLRESPGESLLSKVEKLPLSERKAIHGTVAELPEARARRGVLTKSPTSTTWDLTETKFRPRNYQMKIYAQPSQALSELVGDLDGIEAKNNFIRRGITTKDTLDRLTKSGRLIRDGNVYRLPGRADIEIEPSKVFLRPGESTEYTKAGRESLIKRGLSSGKTVPVGFQTAGRWLGRAGIVGLAATEGYIIYGMANGSLSEREFVTAQSAIAGGGLGGWGGAEAGGSVGLLIAGGPEDPLALITVPAGMLIGSVVGGFGGAKLGELAATGFYGRLDEQQRSQVEAFVYQHYGVSQ
jgi:hypothetical protein